MENSFIQKGLILMLQIFQEAELPKLSQTSLYRQFESTSKITNVIISEIKQSKDNIVTADKIPEILSLIKLNGDVIAKKAVDAYQKNQIIVIHNPTTSKVPPTVPFIVMTYKGKPTVFVFADKVVKKINAANEYTNFMAVLEAAYLALMITINPDSFLMNSSLMLTLCNIYTLMAEAPLEQRLYMKGDNLNKATVYIMTYFYKMIRGNNITPENIPFKRIMNDKMDPSVITAIVDEVKNSTDNSFMGLIKMIMKINPIRYKNLDAMYMSYFTSTCGVSLIFALENLQYLFLLVSSATYKTQLTAFGLNKLVTMPCKKAVTQMSSMISG